MNMGQEKAQDRGSNGVGGFAPGCRSHCEENMASALWLPEGEG